MKKYVLFVILAIVAGITINCSSSVPQNAFRVKTRGKFHLFGIPLPFSVPNPNIALNLKTSTMPGAPGTMGAVNEFNPGGLNVQTDLGGKFDAVNSVVPAGWNAKVAPNQSRCTGAQAPIVSFNAVWGGVYKLNCKWNIQISLRIQPEFVELGGGGNSLTGVLAKNFNDEPLFLNSQNLIVQYYKQIDGEDYILEGEKPVSSVSADGTTLEIPLPNYSGNFGYKNYELLIVEDGANDVYIGHGSLQVRYPCGGTHHCPIGKVWDSEFCYCVDDF